MIDQNFQPATVREVRLVKHIRELERRLYEKGLNYIWSGIPDEIDLSGGHLPLSLSLAASVEGGWASDYTFRVRGRAMQTGNPEALSFGYYMGREAMRVWTKEARAEALLDLHRRLINQLAGAVIAEDPE